jgi:hypothetical protein
MMKINGAAAGWQRREILGHVYATDTQHRNKAFPESGGMEITKWHFDYYLSQQHII